MPTTARIVDLSADDGRHLLPLLQLGFDVRAVALDVEQITDRLAPHIASEEIASRIAAASPTETGFDSESADWVILAGSDRQRAGTIAEAYRLLIAGGWLWIETESRDGLVEDAEATGFVVAEEPSRDASGSVRAVFRKPGGIA
ncbi:MAG: hypothetical protein AAGK21_08890 [Bacteroidota bacterium]